MTAGVELRVGSTRALIAPSVGGALASFECSGFPIVRPTSAQAFAEGTVREFACYPLVPYSNRIAQAMLLWNGVLHPLPRYVAEQAHAIHGNAWQRAWSVIEHSERRATLELVHRPLAAHGDEWPFAYRAEQRFDLAADHLELRLEIRNDDAQSVPVGLGWHPFFERTADTELEFCADGVWRTDDTLLPIGHTAVPAEWDFRTARAIGSTAIDNCFSGWHVPARVRWPSRRISVEISASDACDHLVVYVPPERDFIAIEPVTHMTDAFNRAARGISGTGTRTLAPGDAFSCTMRLSMRHDG
ncbi:MAG: aldose 1-epimerase [Betaproteobacteria bacterium]